MEVKITFDQVKVKDQTKIHEIKVLMVKGEKGDPASDNLEPGAAPGSVQNSYSKAGCLGFYFESYYLVGQYACFYLLDKSGNQVDIAQILSIGDSISCKAGYSWNFAGKIHAICMDDINQISVELDDVPPTSWKPEEHEYSADERGYIWIPEKPTVGSVPIGAGSLAIGLDNQVNEMGSLVGGCYNLCDGRYAIVFGDGNVGGYNVLIIGEENKVLGLFSAANGKKNEIYAKDALAAGRLIVIEKSAEHGNGLGLGLIVRGISQHVAGEYNVALGDDFLEIIGAGSDNTHRKNIRVQKDDGELHIAGSLYTNDNSADGKSGGYKAVTQKDVTDGNVKTTGYRVYGTPIFTQWYGLNVAAGNGTVTIKSASESDIQNAPTRGQTNYGIIDTGNLKAAFSVYGTKCGTTNPSGTAKPGARYIKYSTDPLTVVGEWIYIDDEDSGNAGWAQIR